MPYTLPAWQDTPSPATPISSANLLMANTAINSIDSRLTTVEAGKLSTGLVNAKGNLISGDNTGTPRALLVGTDGQVLTADHTTATGLTWAAPAGASTPDATATTKGIVALAGDLAGTAAAPAINATGTPNSTTFLRGDKTWAVPSAGGGSGIPTSTIVFQGDMVAGGVNGVPANVPAAVTNDQVLYTNFSLNPTTIGWRDEHYGAVSYGGITQPKQPTLNLAGGLSAANNGGASRTDISTLPVWDAPVTSNGVTRISNSFDNYLVNGRFDSWTNGIPSPWYTASQTTVLQVAGVAAGSSAAQVTFTTAGDEFDQVISGFRIGEYLTLSVLIERISGNGALRIELVHHNPNYEICAIVDPITVTLGSGPQWVMMTGRMPVTDDLRVQMVNETTTTTVWKIHSAKVQRGQGVANEWSPTFAEQLALLQGSTQSTLSQGNPGFYPVQPTGNSYQRILLTSNSVIAFIETPDNQTRQFNLIIEQDATGGRQVAWAPRTIGWENGVEPFIDTAPGSVTFIRARWLGPAYGMVAETSTGIGQYIRPIPDPWRGVTLAVPMYVMRYMTSASIDNIVNTVNRWTTLAHRQLMASNGGYLYWSDGYDTDTPVGASFRGSTFDFQGGFNTPGPNGNSTVGTNPIAFSDATVHEYYHMEHNHLRPGGYTDPGGTVGTANFTPYATAVPAIGYTVPVILLNHPWVQDCWIRAYNNVTTRTVTGCTVTNGSAVITTTSSFVRNPGAPNADGSLDGNSNPYVLAGIFGTGIPAPSRTVANVITYSGFNTITFPAGQITNTDLGSQIAAGTGIPSNTGIVSVDTVNNRAVISHIATANGTVTATITNQTRVQSVDSTTQITLSAPANAPGTNVTLTITYPSGNNSALAEWWSQMRTAKHAQPDGVLNTEQNCAGGLASVVTDFENLITHLSVPGG